MKHVKPFVTKEMKDKVLLRKNVEDIKYWVKSWFFDTETHIEYMFSRHFFMDGKFAGLYATTFC